MVVIGYINLLLSSWKMWLNMVKKICWIGLIQHQIDIKKYVVLKVVWESVLYYKINGSGYRLKSNRFKIGNLPRILYSDVGTRN